MVEGILFDFDGTIVDSEPVHREAWNATLRPWDIQFSSEQYVEFVGISDEAFVDYLVSKRGVESTYEKLSTIKGAIFDELMLDVSLNQGVVDLLQALEGKVKIGIASSARSAHISEVLTRKGLLEHFSVIVGADSVSNRKPHPEVYQKACSSLGLVPERCVAVEDSWAGIVSAKTAGMTAVAVPNLYTAKHDFSRADIVCDGFKDPRLWKLVGLC